MGMDKSPCMNCSPKERYEACHDSCKKYLTWKEKKDALREKIFAESKTYAIWDRKTLNRVEKIKKPSGRRRK